MRVGPGGTAPPEIQISLGLGPSLSVKIEQSSIQLCYQGFMMEWRSTRIGGLLLPLLVVTLAEEEAI